MSWLYDLTSPEADLAPPRRTAVEWKPAEDPIAPDPMPNYLRIRPTTVAEAIDRALEWVDRPSRYRLGGGGDVFDHDHPFAKDGSCDCSGFTGHVTGHNRIQRIGGKRISYYTDNVIRDVHRHEDAWGMRGRVIGPGPRHLYDRADGDDVLGCLLVTPGFYVAGKRVRIGHVRIIVEQRDGFRRGGPHWYRHLVVVHCTPNRGRRSAVRSNLAATSPSSVVARRGYIVRPRWYL